MGDSYLYLRAAGDMAKQERADRWANRHEAVRALMAAGYAPLMVSEEARHYRIRLPQNGWFDWWPSTDRWAQSPRPAGRRAKRGMGLAGLLAALNAEAAS